MTMLENFLLYSLPIRYNFFISNVGLIT